MPIIPYKGKSPRIAPSALLLPGVTLIGDVELGEESSVWFGTVIRGDVNWIRIGDMTNIQDRCVVHVTLDKHPTVIGDRVTVGHGAILHGCTVEDACLIGIGATILDAAVIGKHSMVAAGAVVTPNTKIPPESLVMGIPAVVKRQLTRAEIDNLEASARRYVGYANNYRSFLADRQDLLAE
jgi:carbonic anhydrase/acetyltransferase-like protein (isoleucine patch superfamily)